MTASSCVRMPSTNCEIFSAARDASTRSTRKSWPCRFLTRSTYSPCERSRPAEPRVASAAEEGRRMRQSRRAFLRAAAASSTLVVLSVCGAAPAPPKAYRVGWLLLQTQAASKTQLDSFRQAMRDLGNVEGPNYSFEVQEAEGLTERLPTLAAARVARKVDVIVSRETNAVVDPTKRTQSI